MNESATTTQAQPVLIAGQWRAAREAGSFTATNPRTRQPLDEMYPVSDWADCDAALDAACEAFDAMQAIGPQGIAAFLEAFAGRLESRAEELVAMAHAETGLPASPRLRDVELPRTVSQLRQAAAAAREQSWAQATIDTKLNIRSCLTPLGPVCVFGPNNFPFAFNGASGGDFAAAIAAGNPVIAKANSSHPGTTRLLAESAHEAALETGLPPATVQLIYRTSHADGERLVGDERLGAAAYTGSRRAGLKLKAAADRAGKPIYLELSSVNPVVMLPGALQERFDDVAEQFVTSSLMGAGQFCTNPGFVVLLRGEATDRFVGTVADRFKAAPVATLLSQGVERALGESIATLQSAGAQLLCGGEPGDRAAGFCFSNTLMRIDAATFLANPHELQTEAFGNAALFVIADDLDQAAAVLRHVEGSLTGTIYSHTGGADDAAYQALEPILRRRVGRLLNDKMPTGVAVSPAMNHGGPYPATGHPHFTAVGIPAAMRRFGALTCFDQVREHRLPPLLRDRNPGQAWRSIDGVWTRGDIDTP